MAFIVGSEVAFADPNSLGLVEAYTGHICPNRNFYLKETTPYISIYFSYVGFPWVQKFYGSENSGISGNYFPLPDLEYLWILILMMSDLENLNGNPEIKNWHIAYVIIMVPIKNILGLFSALRSVDTLSISKCCYLDVLTLVAMTLQYINLHHVASYRFGHIINKIHETRRVLGRVQTVASSTPVPVCNLYLDPVILVKVQCHGTLARSCLQNTPTLLMLWQTYNDTVLTLTSFLYLLKVKFCIFWPWLQWL